MPLDFYNVQHRVIRVPKCISLGKYTNENRIKS